MPRNDAYYDNLPIPTPDHCAAYGDLCSRFGCYLCYLLRDQGKNGGVDLDTLGSAGPGWEKGQWDKFVKRTTADAHDTDEPCSVPDAVDYLGEQISGHKLANHEFLPPDQPQQKGGETE